MICTTIFIFCLISERFKMSLLQKLFKKNSKHSLKSNSSIGADEKNNASETNVNKPSTRRKSRKVRSSERRSQEWRNNACVESTDSDNNSDETSGEFDDHYTENRKRKLKSQIYKLRKRRERLRRRQTDMLALEQEIRQVVYLISVTKQQTEALKEDILNKKCELKFLGTEVPEGYDMEAKKNEPVFHKKYSAVKSASEARNLLENVRQKMRALQYIELLTYNKYLDFKHDLKSSPVRRRSNFMSRNKKRHFGPVKDAIKSQTKEGTTSNAEEEIGDETDAIPLHKFATVTIESSPQMQSPVDMTATTPPAPAPLLPAHLFRGPLSLISSATVATETFI